MLTPEQLKKHHASVTGSKVGAILGISPYQSKYGLWAEMVGLVEREEISTERMRMGNYAERMIDEICRNEFKWIVAPGPESGAVHPDYSFMFGLIDRFKLTEGGAFERVLEYKNIDRIQLAAWEADGVPAYYEAQCRFYSILHDLPCTLVAVFGGNTVRTYDIERSAEIETFIINECLKFWDMVQTTTAPDPDGSDGTSTALARLYPQNNLTLIDGDGSAEDLIRRRELFAAVEKKAGERKDHYGNRLKAIIGEHDGIVCPSGTKATWKKIKDGVEFDEKRFADENPEQYQKYLVTKPGYRRFNVSFPKPKQAAIKAA